MPLDVLFLVYPGVTQLDFAAPAQLFALGGAQVRTTWKTREPIPTDSGFAIVPTATLEECRKADLICVPGGLGCHDVMDDDEVLSWLRRLEPDSRYVTSVCTGSLILAAAGLLEGYRATSHWLWRDYLELFGAIPTDARVVKDRNRITGGGVTAGLDFGLAVLAEAEGPLAAGLVQLGAEYDPDPPLRSGSPREADSELVETVRRRSGRHFAWRGERIRAAAQRLREPPPAR